MKKLFCFAVLLLFGVTEGKGQLLEISLANGPSLCCGYGKDNQACILVTKMPPLSPSEDPIIVYTWYAKHEKSLKKWNTPVAGRWVPLPWAGTYEVWVIMQYIDQRSKRAYAAFPSNVLVVPAHYCAAPHPTEGDPKD